jgi:hypothetical protein
VSWEDDCKWRVNKDLEGGHALLEGIILAFTRLTAETHENLSKDR